MYGRMRRVVSLLCVLALAPTSVLATTARRLSNEDLANQADVVVIGKVVGLRTTWLERTLVTLATVQVSEYLRGGSGTITVVLPGGVDTNRPVPIAMLYPGAPQMTVEEEVFLFLEEDDWTTLRGYTVLGFSQGKFSIVTDSEGQKVVERDLTRIDLQAATGLARGPRTRVPLNEFKEETQRHLGNR